MKAIEIRNSFGIQSLTLSNRPKPPPKGNEVVVRIKACSLNYRDLMTVKGLYNPKQALPLIPLSDGAGEVVEVGTNVPSLKPGDRVASLFFQDWHSGCPSHEKQKSTLGGPLDGMLAEYVTLPESGVIKVPAHLSDEEAATLPCAALTAWNALEGNVIPGQTVLIQGTGGVSIFALQFSKLMGAKIIVISSSDDKLKRAAQLGADHIINYRQHADWDQQVLDLTQKRGVDHIIEVGGANTLEKSMNCVRTGGSIYAIGILSGIESKVNLVPLLIRQILIRGVYVGPREMFERMNRAISLHQLKPIIHRSYPIDEAQQAFEVMERAEHFGKIIIRCY